MKVRCTKITNPHTGKDEGNRSNWFTVGKDYIVLEIYLDPVNRQNNYRLEADDNKTPGLAPTTDFTILSGAIPSSWKAGQFADTIVLGPAKWLRPGFWEDFFDNKEEAVQIYREEKTQMLA